MQATTSLTGDGQYRLTLTMSRKEMQHFAIMLDMVGDYLNMGESTRSMLDQTFAAIDTLLQATED